MSCPASGLARRRALRSASAVALGPNRVRIYPMGQATTLAILRRLIDATQGNLSQGAAEAVLLIQLTDSDQARMTELAARSNNGSLTPDEGEEYDRYIEVGDLLSLWKSH